MKIVNSIGKKIFLKLKLIIWGIMDYLSKMFIV